MTPLLPDDDRDLRLARRLDRGAEPDGTDALHAALGDLRPAPLAVDADASERLWARVDAATQARTAPDRPALRLVPARVARWAVAATAIVAVGVATWLALRTDVVAVAEGEIVTWTAPDGSAVTLRPHTTLTREGARAYRLDGEAFFAVAPDPDRPFTVEAGGGVVRVLGTRFNVSTWGAQTDVFVEEGRVEVRGNRESVVLGAGEAAVVTDTRTAVLAEASPDTFLDWQRGEMVFQREPVRRVLDELRQHFGVPIALPRGVEDQAISGVLPLGSAAEALDDLGRILGGRFVPDAGGFRFDLP